MVDEIVIKPNPGTKEATDIGCTCPVLDNEYGKGAYIDESGNPQFWYSSDCPIHTFVQVHDESIIASAKEDELDNMTPQQLADAIQKTAGSWKETITESEIWADIDAQYMLPLRQKGDIDVFMMIARYGGCDSTARRRMKAMVKSGEYEWVEIADENATHGKLKVIRRVKK